MMDDSQGTGGPGAVAGRTDWAKIFASEFVSRPRCWETCDGFCCTPTRVQRHFRFLRRSGVDLPHLPGEYAFLKRTGRLQAGYSESFTRHDLLLPNGRVLPIYRAVCNLGGRCSDHAYRPVVCRIYPFMPVPTLDGTVERLEPTALIDLFWDDLEHAVAPCSIVSLTPAERTRYEALCRELFKDPVNILYFKAASIYKNAILRSVREQYPELLSGPEDRFFSQWEKLLVFGKLYRPASVLETIAQVWDALEARLGGPLTPEEP